MRNLTTEAGVPLQGVPWILLSYRRFILIFQGNGWEETEKSHSSGICHLIFDPSQRGKAICAHLHSK